MCWGTGPFITDIRTRVRAIVRRRVRHEELRVTLENRVRERDGRGACELLCGYKNRERGLYRHKRERRRKNEGVRGGAGGRECRVLERTSGKRHGWVVFLTLFFGESGGGV